MAGEDRLYALADDLLRRILYFVPFKEAAATSVLSRRWGSLWRSSGAVNLDVRIHNSEKRGDYRQQEQDFFSRRDAFVRAAQAALDAADAPITRLTLRVDEDPQDSHGYETDSFLNRTSDPRVPRDVIGALVSHRAALGVEELLVVVAAAKEWFQEEPCRLAHETYYSLWLPHLIHLRVLDLTRCTGLTPPAIDDAFPFLETLRLRLCSLNTSDVQELMDAAPRLATVHLRSVVFMGRTEEAPRVDLRCRAVTELVMEFCGMEEQGQNRGDARASIEIDAPGLRYLRYKGFERPFTLTSPALDVAELDLHFLLDTSYRQGQNSRVLFWQFVRNFTNARVLKLKVNKLEDIAVGKGRRTEFLCTFRNAMRLKLQGTHRATSKAAAVAIANLLRCCPALRDLRLKLNTGPSNSSKDGSYGEPFLERKDQMDYDKSVGYFTHRHRLEHVISSHDDDKLDEEVPGHIPGLSGHAFTCLQSSLRSVGLQFRMDNSTSCFGTQLVKFFTDNAKVLKEICVDSGNRKLCEHMALNVERWVAPALSKVCLKSANPAESSWEFSKISRRSPNSITDLTSLTTSLVDELCFGPSKY